MSKRKIYCIETKCRKGSPWERDDEVCFSTLAEAKYEASRRVDTLAGYRWLQLYQARVVEYERTDGWQNESRLYTASERALDELLDCQDAPGRAGLTGMAA